MDALLNFAMQMIAAVRMFFARPDLDDADAVQAWLADLLRIIASAARLTPPSLDDQIVELAQQVVSDEETWPTLYRVLMELFGSGRTARDVAPDRLKAIGEPKKLDPAVIAMIIELIMFILERFLKRDDSAPPDLRPSPAA